MSIKDLLSLIGKGLTKPVKKDDIMGKEIDIRYLKRIDKIFNKGFHFYLDPKELDESKESSIFFRKITFGIDLNLASKKIVNQFEEFKLSLSGIAKLVDLKMERTLPVCSISQNPKVTALQARKELYPSFKSDQKEFLKALIGKLAERNILVFEFVETWNKREKVNIDGFFLNPNVIVLKRQQVSFRREIFTLAHELGHFMLNEEEVETLEYSSLANGNLSAIERWCNDFAYFFLIGDYDKTMTSIIKADSSNDYKLEDIELISKKTHLSTIALYTRLLFQNKINQANYTKIRKDFEERFRQKQEAEKKQRELEKQQGKTNGGSPPKPINSPLLISTIQTAFHVGIISELEVCRTLNIKPNKLETYFE